MSWEMMAAGHFGWGSSLEEGWRKGPWTAEEDRLLIEYVRVHGEGRWNSVSRLAGLKRNGKSCRLRWVNYLRPDLKRGQITPHEESIILELHARWGNRWSTIARSLPGRTDNEIKNYWRTHFKKKAKLPGESSQRARTRLMKRQQLNHHHQQQQEQQQYQLQQLNQMAMKKIMSLLDVDEENKAPYAPQMRQEAAHPVSLNTSSDHQDHGSFYSLFNAADPYVPLASNEEILLWDGLWNLDDVHANFGTGSAPSKAGLQNLVAPYC